LPLGKADNSTPEYFSRPIICLPDKNNFLDSSQVVLKTNLIIGKLTAYTRR